MPINILGIKEWLGWTIFIGVILSLVMFFFSWRLALGGPFYCSWLDSK